MLIKLILVAFIALLLFTLCLSALEVEQESAALSEGEFDFPGS